jgi:hypothetical protein
MRRMSLSRHPLHLLTSPREARYASWDVREEVKRLRKKHKETIAALRARRLELRAEYKQKRADSAAQFRKAIADLRAAAKQAQADLRAELRARLRDINEELRGAREELRGLTPLAREELRLIMLRGENLKSAKAKLAGSKGAQVKNDKLEEALTEILDGEGIDRFADSSKEWIAYIKNWLKRRAKKGANALQRMNVYDPSKDTWEQWSEYKEAIPEELAALQAEWVEAQVEREHERERKHMEEAHGEMERLAARAHKTMEKAAQCADPWTYATLEGLHDRLPDLEYWNSDKLRKAKDELDKEAAHVAAECKRNSGKRTMFRKQSERGAVPRHGTRTRKRGVAKTPRPTRQKPAKAHKRRAVKVERAKARKARKASAGKLHFTHRGHVVEIQAPPGTTRFGVQQAAEQAPRSFPAEIREAITDEANHWQPVPGGFSVTVEGAPLPPAERPAPKAPPARAPGTYDDEHQDVPIEWGTVPNNNKQIGGWIPQVWVKNKPRNSPWSTRGVDLDQALGYAEREAAEEGARYLGDYRVTITPRITDEHRIALAPRMTPPKAPRAPKAPKPPKAARAPKEPKAPKADPAFAKLSPIDRLLIAYRELRNETGLRNVRVYALAKRARMTPRQAHSVLATLSRRGLVNPAFGEPTAVSAEERAAAWELGGQRFMLVEIDEPAPPAAEPVRAPKPPKPRRGGSGGYLLDDERVILATHQRLDTSGNNMSLLFDLRKETGIRRARFDAAIQSLRKTGRAYLESSQGQAVKLTPAQRAAGIKEDGRQLVYFSLR